MAIELEDLTKEACGDNTPGIRGFVYYASAEDIAVFPASIPADFTGIGSYVGDFEMKSGKVFKKLYCTLEMGDLSADLVGARDGKSFGNKLEISHPGNAAQAIGFAEAVKNQNLVFIVPAMSGGYRVLGDQIFPASLDTANIVSGKTNGDTKASSFIFEAKGRAAKHYSGFIPIVPRYYIAPGYIAAGYYKTR